MNMEANKSGRSIITQMSMVILANLSSIAAGISSSFAAIAIPTLMSNTNGSELSMNKISWIAAIHFLASPVGCFISGFVADIFGRKIALITNDFVSVLGWILIVVAYYTPGYLYPILLTGRFISGISVGMVLTTPSVYIAEISSLNLRSTFTTWNIIFIYFGILLCYLLDLCFPKNWGKIATLTTIFPFMRLILILIFLPESYVWLISQSKIDHARDSIKRVFGNTESSVIEEEINSLLEERNKINKIPIYKQFLKRTFVIPMMIMTTYFVFLSFSGGLMIVLYVFHFMSNMAITINSYLINILFVGTQFFGALVLGCISKCLGRRPLSIASGIGISACMLGLTLYLLLGPKYDELDNSYSSWIPIILLVICYFMSIIGFLSIPFAMASEIFPLDIRGIATGLATGVGYLFTFIAIKTYPSFVEAFGENYHFIFLFYGIIALTSTIFVYFFLPETKGKSLHEIEESFKNKRSEVI